MTKEFEFFVKSDLEKYKGEYVAIVGRRIAAHGKNAKQVWQEAKQKFPKTLPTLAKLPEEEALILMANCWASKLNQVIK